MALTSTTTAAAATMNDLIITVTSATGFAAGNFVRIDKEFMVVDRSYVSGTSIPVFRRGDQGSRAVAHQILSPVVTGLFSDLSDVNTAEDSQVPPDQRGQTTISVDTTLSATSSPALPTKDVIYYIDKASAAAITLPAPAKDVDGIFVTFYSLTAAAHVITYTAGFYGDTTSSDLATFAAKVGASMTIVASRGTWGVQSLANVTLG